MAVSQSFLSEVVSFFASRISYISFKCNGISSTVKPTSISSSGNILTVRGLISSSYSGTISELKLMSVSGVEIITRTDTITKTNTPYPRGLLVEFNLEIKEV